MNDELVKTIREDCRQRAHYLMNGLGLNNGDAIYRELCRAAYAAVQAAAPDRPSDTGPHSSAEPPKTAGKPDDQAGVGVGPAVPEGWISVKEQQPKPEPILRQLAALHKLQWSYDNNTAHVALTLDDIAALLQMGEELAAAPAARAADATSDAGSDQ